MPTENRSSNTDAMNNAPAPYGYLREVDGRCQLSIGPDRPADRAGGHATPWAAVYADEEIGRLRAESRDLQLQLRGAALLADRLRKSSLGLRRQALAELLRYLSGYSVSAEPSTPATSIPDGYCLMPRQLTAENGAKALLLGEFKLEVTRECPECLELEEPLEGCEICDGEGEYGQRHTIPWDQIKFIYSEAVKGLALKPQATMDRKP